MAKIRFTRSNHRKQASTTIPNPDGQQQEQQSNNNNNNNNNSNNNTSTNNGQGNSSNIPNNSSGSGGAGIATSSLVRATLFGLFEGRSKRSSCKPPKQQATTGKPTTIKTISSSLEENETKNKLQTTTTTTTTTVTKSKANKTNASTSNSSSFTATATATSTPTTSTPSSSSSSNKTVIPTALPPYEIEVTQIDGSAYIECPLCVLLVKLDTTPDLQSCDHRTCSECMQRYLKTEINHSRLNITCPICSEPLLQNVIKDILKDDKFYAKYESFMLRKVLAAEPDARWCPAPDCGYAVLAYGCASCPRLVCARKGCDTAFCYHCKQEWHPNQTCSSASIQRNKRGSNLNALNISELIEESGLGGTSGSSNSNNPNNNNNNNNVGSSQGGGRKLSKTSQQTTSLKPDDIKECPVCSSRIIKMNDGSCNHMTCSICETEFCWLCMKEISDFHYFSPSGCTFWGKKPWSRKKKLLWQLGMLVGAPICIIFIAGIAVPAIVIGIPVWAARKLHTRLERKQFSRYRKNAIITGGVLLSFIVSPIISAMALAIGVPILLGYVYGVVPLSLCRSSGGCLSSSPSVENLPQQYQPSTSSMAMMMHNSGGGGGGAGTGQPDVGTDTGADGLSQGTTASKVALGGLGLGRGRQRSDVVSIDTATSHKLGNPSIGETSLYMSNISLETNSIGHITTVDREDRESASNAGLAGSIMSTNVDDGHSTRALAGSIMSKESGGYTLIPAEIHNQQNNSLALLAHKQEQQLAEVSSTTSCTKSDTNNSTADLTTTKDREQQQQANGELEV